MGDDDNMNILVVDDHPLVRRGIIEILAMEMTENDIKEADTIEGAMRILRMHPINMLIIDLHLGNENGFDLIEKARLNSTKYKYVILTSSNNYLDFKRARQMEVDGYILKDAFVEDILYAIKVIHRGERYYSPQLVNKSFCNEPKEIQTLTEREKEVLSQLSKGFTNLQISDALFISEGTAKKHVSNILGKLNLRNPTEAVLFARNLYGVNRR